MRNYRTQSQRGLDRQRRQRFRLLPESRKHGDWIPPCVCSKTMSTRTGMTTAPNIDNLPQKYAQDASDSIDKKQTTKK